ncbi:oxygenase MpaB family protein [Mycobacteroides immunogenum]|uniref:oxygenase MpaB family protein n=1 Tax=Mycobacteroides immunogenum TaxID=83262 RepID=UPI003F4A73C3
MTENDVLPTESASYTHPYDYYWRPGIDLRPAPPRLRYDAMWTKSRQDILEPWMDFHEVPRETARTRLLVDHLWQGDELMDAVVDRIRKMPARHGRAMLNQALDHGIESVENPPAEFVALFEHLDNPPGWYDPELWERGRQLWNDSSLAAKYAMVIGDGFGTFVGDEVAYATGATGRFVNDTLRRNLETTAWFRKMTYRGALERFSQPFKDTVRVRLMHSMVRAGLRRSWGDQQFTQHGNPISNSMMMGAAMTFGLIPPLIDHHHGRTRTTADLEAAIMYWAYIAHVFGVAEELIPKTVAEGMETMDYMVAYAGGPSEWTDTMASSALGFVDKGVIGKFGRLALTPVLGLAAYFGGEELTRALVRATPLHNVRLQPWITIAGVAVRANIRLRRLTDKLPGSKYLARQRKGELLWWSATVVNQVLARLGGMHDTSYTHHDATAATPVGCPVPHAPRVSA